MAFEMHIIQEEIALFSALFRASSKQFLMAYKTFNTSVNLSLGFYHTEFPFLLIALKNMWLATILNYNIYFSMHCIALNGYFLTPFNTPAMTCSAGLAMSK